MIVLFSLLSTFVSSSSSLRRFGIFQPVFSSSSKFGFRSSIQLIRLLDVFFSASFVVCSLSLFLSSPALSPFACKSRFLSSFFALSSQIQFSFLLFLLFVVFFSPSVRVCLISSVRIVLRSSSYLHAHCQQDASFRSSSLCVALFSRLDTFALVASSGSSSCRSVVCFSLSLFTSSLPLFPSSVSLNCNSPNGHTPFAESSTSDQVVAQPFAFGRLLRRPPLRISLFGFSLNCRTSCLFFALFPLDWSPIAAIFFVFACQLPT